MRLIDKRATQVVCYIIYIYNCSQDMFKEYCLYCNWSHQGRLEKVSMSKFFNESILYNQRGGKKWGFQTPKTSWKGRDMLCYFPLFWCMSMYSIPKYVSQMKVPIVPSIRIINHEPCTTDIFCNNLSLVWEIQLSGIT